MIINVPENNDGLLSMIDWGLQIDRWEGKWCKSKDSVT